MSSSEQRDDGEEIRTEGTIRRAGAVMRYGGIVGGAAITFVAATYRQFAGEPFPYELTMFVLGSSMVCVILGLSERLTRPLRTTLRSVGDTQQQILEQNARIEQTFAELAEVMPKEFDRSWWRGFAGRSLAETGTDGARQDVSQAPGDLLHFPRPHVPPAASH